MKLKLDKTDRLFLLAALMMIPSMIVLIWTKYFPLWLGLQLFSGIICFIIYAYIDSKRVNREMAEWEIQSKARAQRLDELEAESNREPEAPPALNSMQRFLRHLAYRRWFQTDADENHTIH